MNSLTNELLQLRKNDPDIALVIDAFREIEHIYREALEAMGVSTKHTTEVRNSAEVTISFHPTPLLYSK